MNGLQLWQPGEQRFTNNKSPIGTVVELELISLNNSLIFRSILRLIPTSQPGVLCTRRMKLSRVLTIGIANSLTVVLLFIT